MTQTADEATGRRVYIDKQTPEAFRALRAMADTVRGVAAGAGLDRVLVELVNIRVSQLNACAYCLNLHTETALRAGESAQRLGVLAAWRDTGLFSPKERAALALAEATTHPSDSMLQSTAYSEARSALSDDEISAVIWVAITINAANRVSILSKHPVRRRRVTPPAPVHDA